MSWLDWLVVAAYGAVMLGIGWYYARQNRSAEDYLLGGRAMSPIALGLSLFATLVSTLSYLAWPGEVLAYGPMMLGQIAAYPLIVLIVGYGLIPLLMKQPVTSAYEILETKLGTSIRLAGATVFLLLRLGWMATILYATSAVVLVPLLGLSPQWTPLLCVALGTITAMYSSWGGIRAVVMTDALQSLTMLAGAVVTLAVITVRMGGVAAWWPEVWPAHWPEREWGFDPSSRAAFGILVISTTIWYVCTNGSDQMVIQRYLSNRNPAAARQTLIVSLLTDVCVASLLAITGIALLGFYRVHSPNLESGQQWVTEADKLYPQFIMTEMPAGLAGLVLAAILSAAMSSLSSGMNSTSGVIERDFLSRRKPAGLADEPTAGTAEVARMRWLSWLVAAVAISLSMLNLFVEGNLIERCFKIVNLLTAPLFVLFFLALFVPWANSVGAWLGLIASVATAILIAYAPDMGLEIGIGFVWMMPCSLLVGIAVGTLASAMTSRPTPSVPT